MKYQVKWMGDKYVGNKRVPCVDILGKYDTKEKAIRSIYDWWKLNVFTPRYIRHWEKVDDDGHKVTVIDYGNHTCFYYIVEMKR